MDAIWKLRREALAVVGIVWLAGFHFFYDGFYHMAAFWLVLAPLALANIDLLGGREGLRWKQLLALLLAWQLGCGVIRAGAGVPVAGGFRDLLAVVLLVVAVLAVARVSWGWKACRAAIFVSAVATSAWALVEFYLLSDLGLDEGRLRNVLIYPIGLNAVLTGLLAGFSMVAGFDLVRDGSRWRWWIRGGLALLAFALMATQSRGAMLATLAGLGVMIVVRRRQVLPEVVAALAGVAAFLVTFVLGSGGGTGPDLVERGATGRFEIWRVYLDGLEAADWWIGTGRVPALEESVLGWFVHHPHAGWVSQIVWCGIPGLLLLGAFLGLAGASGWKRANLDATPLALLAFGVVGLTFDGGQIVSLASSPRIEPLLVLVPAVVALVLGGRRETASDEVGAL
ncbi:O-antigen ligase family protein [Haloferula sp. A504]|uniref:O-antigen ligase family protein n=1 Tax=Haloferula sp. A504 TaxID=3373601 RepID=UPI0031C85597|nr:O-antigen ligase family protein [Verrucomicrobiaceae bacterium E54]